jgi:hypothetical protein
VQVAPPSLVSAGAVADLILAGTARGEYHLRSPDVLQNLLISTGAGVSPRAFALAEVLLAAPIVGLIQVAWRVLHADRIAAGYGRRVAQEQAGAKQ